MMPKFKKGDRVRCVEADGEIREGMTGTVIEDSAIPYVDWDDFLGGISDLGLTGHNNESVLEINEDCLELIKPEIDLTAIDKPFGLLDAETQKALDECGGPYVYFDYTGNWVDWTNKDPFNPHLTYRKKPVSVRVKHSFEAKVSVVGTISSAPPSNATVTYETVGGVIDWSTYKVQKHD